MRRARRVLCIKHPQHLHKLLATDTADITCTLGGGGYGGGCVRLETPDPSQDGKLMMLRKNNKSFIKNHQYVSILINID